MCQVKSCDVTFVIDVISVPGTSDDVISVQASLWVIPVSPGPHCPFEKLLTSEIPTSIPVPLPKQLLLYSPSLSQSSTYPNTVITPPFFHAAHFWHTSSIPPIHILTLSSINYSSLHLIMPAFPILPLHLLVQMCGVPNNLSLCPK